MSPLYDFKCESCGNEFEDLISGTGYTPTLPCPQCEHTKVTLLPSLTGGYKFANGSGESSVTPKSAGSPKRLKK